MGSHPTSTELAELVRGYFASQGTEVSYDPEQGMGEAMGAVFSVHNLADHLALVDRAKWPDFVAWHFRHLEAGPPEIPSQYSPARRRLRVRLACTGWVDQLPFKEIARPVSDDLHEVLMITIEGGASTVPPQSLESWGEAVATIWKDARENTMLDEPRERRAMLKPTGERLTWVRGSWWVSTLLLDLGRYLPPDKPHGALAMVPVRDALVFHEISDDSLGSSMMSMVEFGLSIYFEGPDRVSPHVYWWRDGEIRRVVAFDDGLTRPVWGDEFREVLADLDGVSDSKILN